MQCLFKWTMFTNIFRKQVIFSHFQLSMQYLGSMSAALSSPIFRGGAWGNFFTKQRLVINYGAYANLFCTLTNYIVSRIIFVQSENHLYLPSKITYVLHVMSIIIRQAITICTMIIIHMIYLWNVLEYKSVSVYLLHCTFISTHSLDKNKQHQVRFIFFLQSTKVTKKLKTIAYFVHIILYIYYFLKITF